MTLEDNKDHLEANPILTSSREIIRVLHIDDDENVQMFLKVFIEADQSINVTSVQNAEDAIQLVQTGAFDCFVSDYDMPGMDGITLAGKIRGISNIPIIIYTGRGSEEVAERAFAAGIDDYIRKENAPAHYQLVSKRIRQAVERRRSNESYRNLFESASDAIFIHDLEGKILDANEVLCKRLGYPKGELLGKLLGQFMSPQQIDFSDNLKKIIKQGHAIFESTHITKEGNKISVEVSAKVIKYMGVDAVLSFSRDISDRKRFEAQMKERLEALQSHALELSNCVDVNAVANTTYQILNKIMGYSFFGLGSVDGNVLRFIPSNIDDKDWGLEYPLDVQGICGRVVKTGSTIIVPDVRLDPEYIRPKSGYKYLSEMTVPVKIGGKVVAVINVEDEKLNRFTEDDVRLIEIFSEHVASSLHRIELLNKTRKHLSRIEKINTHAVHLANLSSVKEVAEYSFNIIEELLGFGDGCIGLVEGDVLKFKYARNLNFQIPDLQLSGRGITAKAYRTGKSQLVHDTRLDPDFVKASDPADYLSELDVPVKVDGRVVAVINLEDQRPGFFSEEDREIVEILAESVASAIKRIGLLESVSHYTSNLEALHRHAADLAKVESIEEVAAFSFHVIESMLGFNSGSFSVIDDNHLRLIYSNPIPVEQLSLLPLSGGGVTARVATTGESQMIPDVRLDPDYVRKAASITSLSELAIPVKLDGRVVAVINLESESINAFSKGDQRIIEVLAEHVASAISRIEQFRAIRASQEALSQSEGRFRYILDSAPEGVTVNIFGNLVYVNQHFADMVGYTVDELFRKGVFEITHENYREMVEDRTRRRALGEDVSNQYEVELIRKDGTILQVEYSISQINFNGEIASLTFIRDISQRNEQLELEKKIASLHKHAHELNELKSIDEVGKITLDILEDHLNCSFISIQLASEGYLHILATKGAEPIGLPMPIQGKGLTARVAREKLTILVADTRIEPGFIKGSTESLSELAVPILCKGELLGVLNAESLELNAFSENDRVLMETLADEVGPTIVGIKALELEHSYNNKLEALHGNELELSIAETLDEVAELTLKTVECTLGFDQCDFGVVEGKMLRFHHLRGVEGDVNLSLSGRGITVRAVRTGETQIVPDVSLDDDFIAAVKGGFRALSEVVVPVRVGDDVVAVVNVESLRINAYSGQDVKLLEILAETVASAISRIEQMKVIKVSEEKYRKVLDSSLESVFLLSGTKFLYVNNHMAKLLGYESPRDLIGEDISKVLTNETIAEVKERTLSRQMGEAQPIMYEISALKKDGTLTEAELVVSLTEYEGKPAVLAFARDISDRKRYQAKLTQLQGSGRRFAGVSTRDEVWDATIETVTQILGFDFVGIGIVEGNTVKYVRSVGAELPKDWTMDLSKPSITSRAIETAIPQLVRDTSLDPDYLSGPGMNRSLSELAIPIIVDGHPVTVLNIEGNRPSMFTEADMSLIQILVGQVSSALDRLTYLEEEIKRVETRQKERLEGIERMSGMVRHDLRGPLQTIQSASYMLRRRPERIEELTGRIDESVEYAVRILEDLKVMMKPEALNRALTNLGDLVEKCLDCASIPATVNVVRNLAPLSLEVDQYRIHRVVDNLVKNGVEAMPDGGTLTLKVEAVDGAALLTVRDTGQGIKDEVARNLFTPFYTTKTSGTGLGLAICRQVVEAHGGRITFESMIGEGTTFTVVLPISQRVLADKQGSEDYLDGTAPLAKVSDRIKSAGSGNQYKRDNLVHALRARPSK